MVDGVCLVVDAAEGPMTQTRYVCSRAMALGLKPVVVLNKCDLLDKNVAQSLARREGGVAISAAKRADHEPGAAPDALHQWGQPGGSGHGREHDHRDRQ